MFAGAKAPTNSTLLGRTKRHVQYTVNTEMDFTICHIHLSFGQFPTTVQFSSNQPVTKLCRLSVINAHYKVVNPIGEVHRSEVIRENLDSNCWNQMIFTPSMGLHPIVKSEFCNANTMAWVGWVVLVKDLHYDPQLL